MLVQILRSSLAAQLARRLPHAAHLARRAFFTRHSSFLIPAALPLFLFLFAIYLLTYTPHINSSDGLAMFSTAESIIRRGALDIEQIRWLDLQQGTFGLDGLLYSRKGIGVPIGLLPLTWLGLVVPWFGTVSASLLFNPIVTALTAVLLLAYLRELGFSQRTGLIVALTFGLATLAWPYAKSLFSDPFSGLLLLAAAFALLKFRHCFMSRGAGKQGSRGENFFSAPLPLRSPALLYPLLAGLLLGWNVATRYAEALFLPVFGLLLLYYLFTICDLRFTIKPFGLHQNGQPLSFSQFTIHNSQFFINAIIVFSLPILLIGLSLMAFNLSRYGDPFNTGYLPNETFSAVLWQGLAGQLVSPGRGLLLYCPIFILSFVGLPRFFRRHRPEAVLTLSIILIHLLLYGKWFMWHGGFAWGPRFMIPTLPFWALFLAPVVARSFPNSAEPQQKRSRTGGRRSVVGGRLVFLSLAMLSLVPQLLAVTIDFSPFQGWLLDTGLPLFDPQTFFDPQFSPLLHAWSLINRYSLDLAWAWQGQFNGWLLAVLVVNIGVTGYFLIKKLANWQIGKTTPLHSVTPAPLLSSALPLLSTLIAVTFLLAYTHTLPEQSLQAAVAALNEAVRPTDAVIVNYPEITLPFAELYQGRAPVLGLNNGGHNFDQRLTETMVEHEQIWWLPNWLPPEESVIEQRLLANGFRARNDNFEGQRLALFAFPSDLSANLRPVDETFAGQITLIELAYPPAVSSGAALPIRLQWQAQASLTEDYHVFIHLVGADGSLVAQADGQPVLWARPTSTWTAGETIIDRHGLWVPPKTAPGTYRLRVGLYRPIDGQRLLTASGDDSVEFETTIQ